MLINIRIDKAGKPKFCIALQIQVYCFSLCRAKFR